jgi:hypothetical protein
VDGSCLAGEGGGDRGVGSREGSDCREETAGRLGLCLIKWVESEGHEEWKIDCTYSPASEVALSKPLARLSHPSGVAYKS